MRRLKIVHVHNFYQHAGGEDKVVGQEIGLLRELGHEVVEYQKSNDEIKSMSLWGKGLTMLQTLWSYRSYKDMKRFIAEHKPDIVHFHNTFPLISPSAYYAAKKQGVPVVQTLHNYRLLCPAGAFFRQGQVCEKCAEGTLLHSVAKGCYRESRAQTAVVAAMLWANRILRTWHRKVDRYIVLTEFAKRKFIEYGLPESKIAVSANFTSHRSKAEETPKEAFFLFVGRLSKEKGAEALVQAWKGLGGSPRLVIIGDGPEENVLKESASECPNIEFLGKQDSQTVMRYMREARFLVVPSICYEGFPMAVIEAYSVGTPVIAHKIGSLQEVVEDGMTGYHYESGRLQEAIAKTADETRYENMRENVRRVFRTKYTKELNIARLMDIYGQLLPQREEREAQPTQSERPRSGAVLESNITALSFDDTVQQIEQWAADRQPRYVCVCTTHSLVTATDNPQFKQALSEAGICTPDGMPLVWALRALGYKKQERVDGSSLMQELCRVASLKGYGIYLYGCTPVTLAVLQNKLERDYPGIRIVGTCSPPFRQLSEAEEKEHIDRINMAEPHLVFVALGCPKQEIWMNKNQHLVKGVMLGVGAAFDYIAGNITRPPMFIQRAGLEWLFRLFMEPRRLWKRYLYNNSMFIFRYLKLYRRNREVTWTNNYHTEGSGVEKSV